MFFINVITPTIILVRIYDMIQCTSNSFKKDDILNNGRNTTNEIKDDINNIIPNTKLPKISESSLSDVFIPNNNRGANILYTNILDIKLVIFLSFLLLKG